ncbi:unnamed protein product [Sphagnum balticum]
MAVRARLATAARAAIAGCVDLYAVGSTVNGCGTSSSDMDLCAIVANTKDDHSMKDTKMIDSRLPVLALVLKQWAVNVGVVDAQNGRINRWVECLRLDSQTRWHTNTQSLAELLFGFFVYYDSVVDYDTDAISIRDAALKPRWVAWWGRGGKMCAVQNRTDARQSSIRRVHRGTIQSTEHRTLCTPRQG